MNNGEAKKNMRMKMKLETLKQWHSVNAGDEDADSETAAFC